RGAVRFVTGAEKHDRAKAKATLAGAVRRGYLKSIAPEGNCSLWPGGGTISPSSRRAGVWCMTRRTRQNLLGAGAVLLAVIVGRALLATSPAPAPTASASQAVDEEAAVAHLSSAIRFATESVSQEGPVSAEAFDGLNAFTATTYPQIAKKLKREQVN